MDSIVPTTQSLFFDALFLGGAIFVAIGSIGVGFWIGYTRTSAGGILGWLATVLDLLVVWFFMSDTLNYLLGADEWLRSIGEADLVDVEDAVYLHMAMYPTLLLTGFLIGRRILMGQFQALVERSHRVTAGQLVRQLDVVANHPQLASAGWFKTRWSSMDADAKRAWAEKHIAGLRQLWLEAEGQGLQLHGHALPMLLAEIDTD